MSAQQSRVQGRACLQTLCLGDQVAMLIAQGCQLAAQAGQQLMVGLHAHAPRQLPALLPDWPSAAQPQQQPLFGRSSGSPASEVHAPMCVAALTEAHQPGARTRASALACSISARCCLAASACCLALTTSVFRPATCTTRLAPVSWLHRHPCAAVRDSP